MISALRLLLLVTSPTPVAKPFGQFCKLSDFKKSLGRRAVISPNIPPCHPGRHINQTLLDSLNDVHEGPVLLLTRLAEMRFNILFKNVKSFSGRG